MTKKELESILKEVEQEVGDLLKSQTADLKKAVGEESPGEESSSASMPAESSPAGSPPAPSASPEAPPAESASPEAPPAPEASESADPAEQSEQMSPEQLQAEYSQMPPEMLKMHYLAAKAALAQVMGMAGDESAPPPAPAPEAPPASPEAPPAPAMKAEPMPEPKSNVPDVGSVKGNGESPLSVKKSELDEVKAQVEQLTKALALVLEQPLRKAATSLGIAPKAETKDIKSLTKSEITAKLSSKTADPTLKKNDRELVNKFYDGQASLEEIKHLLN